MKNQKESRCHHYVPQKILRNFCFSDSEEIYVFDKNTLASRKAKIKSLYFENGFHTLFTETGRNNRENEVTGIENSYNSVVDHIVRNKGFKGIDELCRKIICRFITFQFLRTSKIRKSIDIFSKLFFDMGKSSAQISGLDKFFPGINEYDYLSENEVKELSLRLSINDLHKHCPSLERLCLMIYETSADNPFFISDSPVTLFKEEKPVGLEVPGIQIYLPISSTLALAAICPSILEKDSGYRKRNNNFQHGGIIIENSIYNPYNASIINSLQVANAERFIASPLDNFDIVRNAMHNIANMTSLYHQ